MRVGPLIEVVYEDAYLVVVNKPAGLLVVPTPKNETHTLTNILIQQFKEKFGGPLYPCHRLDRDTSGLIIYAKDKKTRDLMMLEFKRHRVEKKYLALAHGKLKRPSGLIEGYIEDIPIGGSRHRHIPKMAITRFALLDERKDYSIVQVWPMTGRTNQIRIHFKQMGNPLLGERKYAFARDFNLKFKRVALHAAQINFRHPISGKRIILKSPLPEDMASFIKN